MKRRILFYSKLGFTKIRCCPAGTDTFNPYFSIVIERSCSDHYQLVSTVSSGITASTRPSLVTAHPRAAGQRLLRMHKKNKCRTHEN